MMFEHKSVLLEETIDSLNIRAGGIYVDGTLGRAGHSREIAKQLTTGHLICIDRDMAAIDAAKERLAPWMDRVSLVHSNFADLDQVLTEAGVPAADGMLFDLGVSSPQLDDASRGFSYQKDAPLDMRMDKSAPFTAEMLLNEYPQNEIARILKIYGEERFATQIAANVVKERTRKPLKTCGELVNIIERSIPAKFKLNGPCSRKSFQAIRIAVNGELDGLYEFVLAVTRRLKKGGRVAILTFHSLEDRIVKQVFRDLCTGCTCPKNFPVCVCGRKEQGKPVGKQPVTAGEEELRENSRSKSAKLRIIEKIT